jgi:small conductance mechanosensitive channel
MPILRIIALVVGFVLLGPTLAAAQVIPLPFSSSGPSAPDGIQQSGLYQTAPITLDGTVLFTIAIQSNAGTSTVPMQERVTTIESALGAIVATTTADGTTVTAYEPRSLKVIIAHDNGQTLLEAVDAKHHAPLPIVTVTSVDAQYHGASVDTLAAEWQDVLADRLQHALQQRQPATVVHSITRVERGAVILAILTALAVLAMGALRRRAHRLQETARERERTMQSHQSNGQVADPHAQRRRTLGLKLRSAGPEQRAKLFSSASAVVLWLLLLLWFTTITWALSLFPQTTPFAVTLSRSAVGVVAIWIVTGLLNRGGDLLITRVATALHKREGRSSEDNARKLLRVPTIASALAGFKTFVLVFLAALATFGEIGVPVGSVITIGGLVAVAVSLAAQNFVRDFLNGFLVLLEDQYVVGDFVTINGMTGIVEDLTLRIVQLRDGGGSLVTVPHSTVTTVTNHSRNWSRIDYRLSIDPAADPSEAIGLLRDAIDELAHDPEWREAIHGPVEWAGIDGFSHDWTLIRASVKTAPLRQFQLRRELNARVRRKFTQAGIGFGPTVPADQVPIA